MTALTGYIQGLGGGEKRTVDKTGKEVKLSVFDNIDDVIVFNQAGETTQETLTGKNLIFPKYQGRSDKGVDFTVNFDGSITCYGLATANAYSAPNLSSDESKMQKVPAGTYTLSGAIPDNARVYLGGKYVDDSSLPFNTDTGSGRTFTLTQEAWVYPEVLVLSGVNADFTVYIQLEVGSQRTEYEPYCGGIPSPNPDYPQAVEGIGFLYHGSYAVAIDYDDGDERDGRILATGLAYPLYEGDILDFANSKVIRAKGCLTKAIANMNVSEDLPGWSNSGIRALMGSGINQNYTNPTVYCNIGNNFSVNTAGESNDIIFLPKTTYGGLTQSQWIAQYPDLTATFVFPLASPVEEYITITGGDIADIGTATVTADGTLRIKYDKAEMAIRKYSAKPDWQKIGYTDTPQIILDAFDYSKRIYDTWTPSASYDSKYRGDKALKFFPEVDLTGATNYSAMFQESGILSTPPLTIGDGSSTVINSQWMFQTTPIEKIELTTSEATQKAQIANIFNGCTMLKNAKLTLSASGSMQYAFADCTRLERIEDGLETSDVTSFSGAFRACSSLLYLYELDLSSCTTCYRAFQNCTSLYSAPYLNNILTGGNFQQMFWNCSSLRILPPYNLGSPSNLTNMFQGTGSNLEEASRINILFMLAGCTYSGTKTLAHLGFTSSMYSAASWQALPHYNDFVSAGWSIGYN